MKKLLWIATTAVLLALIVVAQFIPIPASLPLVRQLITGSLVNMILIAAAGTVGLGGGTVLAVLSPTLAFLLGQLPVPFMIPVVAIGNFIIVFFMWLFIRTAQTKEKPQMVALLLTGVISGAVLKCAFLWVTTANVITPILTPILIVKKNLPMLAVLNFSMSWPQAFAALIGGILALLILPKLRFYLKKNT